MMNIWKIAKLFSCCLSFVRLRESRHVCCRYPALRESRPLKRGIGRKMRSSISATCCMFIGWGHTQQPFPDKSDFSSLGALL